MCKLLGPRFVDSRRWLGFPGINHRACTCWASFSVSPVAPEGFFGLQSAFEIPCKILGLGGHLNLDGCVDKLFDHFPNTGLFSLPIPNLLHTVSGLHLGLKHSRPFGIRKKLSVVINEKEKPFPEFSNYVSREVIHQQDKSDASFFFKSVVLFNFL